MGTDVKDIQFVFNTDNIQFNHDDSECLISEHQRECAKELFSIYKSYVDAGFNQKQAMEILIAIINRQ